MPAPTEIGLEPRGVVRREKRGDVAALAPAHRADLGGIDNPLRDQRVDAGQHVPGVADAEIADVQRSELLAVARRCRDSSARGRGRRAGPTRRSDRWCS